MKGKDKMKGTYTYDELAEAYDNFLVPALAIYVNNEDVDLIQKKGLAIGNVQVTLSTDGASGLQLQVSDVLDPKGKNLKKDITDSFSVGTVIEVKMGYGSDLTSVFKGYVTEYQTSYQHEPTASVTAVDVRKLLMQNRRQHLTYTGMSYSEIFEDVFDNYGDFCDELHIDDTEGTVTLYQNGTDYQFIRDMLCYQAKREFYVVGGDVYFIEPEEGKEAAFLKLEWGKSLFSYRRNKSYMNKTVRVRSSQEDKTEKVVSGTVSTEDDTPSLTEEGIAEEYEPGEGLDTVALENYLKKIIGEKKKKSSSCYGSLIGLPELVPGRKLEIGGVATEDGGSFYISEVCHSFGDDGFTTSFTCGTRSDRLTESRKEPELNGLSVDSSGGGFRRAVVKNNWDENQKGKIQVEFLTGEEGTKTTDWIPVLHPHCGDGYGFYFLTEIDTEVVVTNLSGDANSLVAVGSLWNKVDGLPEDTAGEGNAVKRILTKSGHEVVFDEKDDSAGIRICTGNKLSVELSDKDKKISVLDENGKNGITIDVEAGTLKLFADKKICLSAGGKDQIVIESSKVTVESNQIEQKGSQSMTYKTQNLSVQGDITEIKASGSMKLNSSGITEIKGSMVKVN